MAIIKEVRGHVPVVGEGTFLAETAVLIGDVTVGRDCSIWYGAVLRGDVNSIRIGDGRIFRTVRWCIRFTTVRRIRRRRI